MIPDPTDWHRVVKLDPARVLSSARLQAVRDWRPDAVVVGGTGGYGAGEVLGLLMRLRPLGLPLALEISDLAAVCPGFDLYLVPMVLNSRQTEWIIGHHHAAVKRFAHRAEWERLVVEGYCILNPAASAAQLTQAHTEASTEDVVAYARVAEHVLHLPIFYLEYSGVYGPPQMVESVRRVLGATRLWYGGGITSERQAAEMGVLAHTIVVGNAVYDEERGGALLAP